MEKRILGLYDKMPEPEAHNSGQRVMEHIDSLGDRLGLNDEDLFVE